MEEKYKRMVSGMKKDETEQPWHLYILRCKNGSLYTGVTNDLDRRYKMHQDGKAAKYTRTRRPVELVYSETCLGRREALVRECEIKEYSKKKKEELVLKGTSDADHLH